ncbi:SGNH hydrolase-type esterase domain-containing protein [Aspergillus granulosus]|uniref:SGNH hydrolase-type esterase domain-containing protein n=1 Tax=Aspergillus granulosus TaxID=176169 RepID=A0ABR4HA10_9EURO
MALSFDKIILFGDSITQGAYDPECGFAFGAGMQNAYARKMDVIQRGFSGYNSDHAAAIIPYLFEQETNVKLMIVFFGTNDSIVPESKNHVPIPRFKENIRKIVVSAQKAGAKVVIIGPGPFDHHGFVAIMEEGWVCDRTTLRARMYCDAAVELGCELGVPVVPLWGLIMADLGWKEGDDVYGLAEVPDEGRFRRYFYDGLHFLGKAYRIMFEQAMKAIRESYPELDPDNIQDKLPLCDEHMTLDSLREALARTQ